MRGRAAEPITAVNNVLPAAAPAYRSGDAIAAIASAPGASCAMLIRLSGPGAFEIARTLFRPDESPDPFAPPVRRAARAGRWRVQWTPEAVLRLGADAPTDAHAPALAYIYPAPRSFTREDMVEIHLPGSPPLAAAALRALASSGARPALAGEFAWRAFVNGRIGAAEAAALAQLLGADADADADALRRDALGRLDRRRPEDASLARCRDAVWSASARLEALLDFPEHAPDGGAPAAWAADWRELAGELASRARDRRRRGAASEGRPVIRLAGLTNAGKSSLFNALLGRDAALASAERSTTRDRLSAPMVCGGVAATLEDLPGFDPESGRGRETAGFDHLNRLLNDPPADLIVWTLDASRPPDDAELAPLRALLRGRRLLLALHKADLPEAADWPPWLSRRIGEIGGVAGIARTSARTGAGLDELRRLAAEALAPRDAPGGGAGGGEGPGGGPLAEWEAETWERAAAECREAAAEWEAGFGELSAERLRAARDWLAGGRGLGAGDAEALLARIFGSLCVGK